MKQNFKELLEKSDLFVTFLPDGIICCTILHNILLGQSYEEVEELLEVLRIDGLQIEFVEDDGAIGEAEVICDHIASASGSANENDRPGCIPNNATTILTVEEELCKLPHYIQLC